MTQQRIIQQLETYERIWGDSPFQEGVEPGWITATKRLLESNPDCFHRTSLDYGHVTGSGLVISDDCTEVLLTHHHVLHRWLQLGGHADGSSDLPEVARREVQEEAGILDPVFLPYEQKIGQIELAPMFFDLDVHLIPDGKKEKSHLHFDFRYLLIAPRNTKIAISEESNDLKWFKWDEAYAVVDSLSLKRLFDKARWLTRP